jgi:hypothetical protein
MQFETEPEWTYTKKKQVTAIFIFNTISNKVILQSPELVYSKLKISIHRELAADQLTILVIWLNKIYLPYLHNVRWMPRKLRKYFSNFGARISFTWARLRCWLRVAQRNFDKTQESREEPPLP